MMPIALSCGKNRNYKIACMDFFYIFKKKIENSREYIQQNLIYEMRLKYFFFLFLLYLFSIIMCSKQGKSFFKERK